MRFTVFSQGFSASIRKHDPHETGGMLHAANGISPGTRRQSWLLVNRRSGKGRCVMNTVLVTYATNAGSTAEVAGTVADAIRQRGYGVDVCPIGEVVDLGQYDTVIVGAPMILGWHSLARRFLRRNRKKLQGKKTALFACAMKLTVPDKESLPELPLVLDPNLVSRPAAGGRPGLKERFTTVEHYLVPILRLLPDENLVSAAIFYGKLDLTALKWYQALFVMIFVQATPGDYRDFAAISSWAQSLPLEG